MQIHKNMNNQEIAQLLRDVAAAYEVIGEDFFRIRAYQNAADAVEHSTTEMKDIWDRDMLQSVPGIGANIAQHLDELFTRGKSPHFENILKKLPQSVYQLLKLPGVGAKTAAKLARELNLSNPETVFDDLVKAAEAGKIATIEGFGEKSQNELFESVERFRRRESKIDRMLLPYATEIADKIVEYMRQCPAVEQIEPLGSLRRNVATVGDIDLAVATKRAKEVIAHFKKWKESKKVLAAGENTARLIHYSGAQIDIKTQDPASFGALLQHFTGSKEHNIALREYAQKKGLSLSEYGIQKAQKHKNTKARKQISTFKTEREFYKALGMDWIPPELRENKGEIEAALNHQLPNLVKIENIKGDLHIHSNFDLKPSHDLGKDGFTDIIKQAIKMGYEYVGFAEHNPANKLSDDKIYSLIKAKNRQIEQVLSEYKNYSKIRVYKLLEVDILANGDLPLTDKSIKLLDAMVVSIHSSFRQNAKEMTTRILSGLVHPKARILGHPTGRLLQEREGVEADWGEIFKFCARHNKALEVNCYPNRLDLPDDMVREAAKLGVKFVIGTDSHDVESLKNMRYGVAVARRGWLERKDVLNTLPMIEFEKWLYDYKK